MLSASIGREKLRNASKGRLYTKMCPNSWFKNVRSYSLQEYKRSVYNITKKNCEHLEASLTCFLKVKRLWSKVDISHRSISAAMCACAVVMALTTARVLCVTSQDSFVSFSTWVLIGSYICSSYFRHSTTWSSPRSLMHDSIKVNLTKFVYITECHVYIIVCIFKIK